MRPMDRSRKELVAVLAFTLAGAVLRLWSFGQLGLSHFDEGIYALAGSWSLAPGGLARLDPMIVPYAPPGFPILVGLAFLVLGFADVSAILASALCGIATIPASAWVGRRTFGPGAGAAAAALAAGSLAHVAFSRKALTDVPFVLSWILAVGVAGRFLERPSAGRAIAAGVAVGVAQNFKYNGWLLGVVLVCAAAARLLPGYPADEVSRRQLLRVAALLALAAGVALLVYAPWFAFVEAHGGYRGLVIHHRSYLGGAGSWYPFLGQQLAQVSALSGGPWWQAATWVLASLSARWVRGGSPRSWSVAGWAGLVLGAILSGATANLGWWVGIAVAPWLIVGGSPAARLLGSWWLLLSVLTPCYHPYARLWLPLGALGWLLLAGVIVQLDLRQPCSEPAKGSAPMPRWTIAVAVWALALGVGQEWWTAPRPLPLSRLFGSSATLRNLVHELPEIVPPGAPIGLLARRPLAFYLLIQGRYPFRLLSGAGDLTRSIPAGDWAILDDGVLGTRARLRLEGLSPVHTFRELLDPVTLLDVAPGAAFREADRGPIAIEVVRRSPGVSPLPTNASTRATHAL